MQVEICRTHPECNHRKGLVRPREVTPDDGEVHLREDKTDAEHRDGDDKALRRLFLRNVQPVRKSQARRAERRITRGNRASNDTKHREDRTDAQAANADCPHKAIADFIDNAAGTCLFECCTETRRTIIERCSCCSPAESNDALGNHRTIEDRAPHILIVETPRHDW